MAEMHYATPGAGWRLARHLAVAAIVGAAVITLSEAYQPALVEWVRSDPTRMRARAQLVIAVVSIILLGPVAALAVYMWRLGTRTLREQRFPPENHVVIRNVLVLRGAQALARGRLLRGLAGFIIVMIAFMALIMFRLATLPAS